MGLSKLWGKDSSGARGFVFSHVKSIYYNWSQKKLLSTKLDEIDESISSLNSRSIQFFTITISSGNEESALNLLDNPKQIEGMPGSTSPYMLIFNDLTGTGPFTGGQTLIIGYEYSTGLHGAQFSVKYDQFMKKRGKRNGVWSDWSNI